MAGELVRLVAEHVEPRLHQLASDTGGTHAVSRRVRGIHGTPWLCRIAALRSQCQGTVAAATYVHQRIESLGDRTDAAAEAERQVAPALLSNLGAG